MAVDIDSTGIPKFKWRVIGDTAWTYIANGDGAGLVPASFSMGSAGTSFKIGIIGYASDTIGVPWLFTADSMELEAATSGTISETLGDTTSTATGSVSQPVTGSVTETLGDVTSAASGTVPTVPPANRTSVSKLADHLRAEGIYNSVQTNEIVFEWLISEGVGKSNLNTMLYQYLGGLGYTGAFSDRMRKWSVDV